MDLLGLGENWETVREPVEEMLYGGQAGGGKSHVIRVAGVTICLLWPGSIVPIFRRTYRELEDTHIGRIQGEVPLEIATYIGTHYELRFKNGSKLLFRYCEADQDVHGYQSAEWSALLVDEATHFTEFQLRYLRTRVRSTRPDWRPTILYTANPGNRGHAYFRKGFVEPAPPETMFQASVEDGGLRRYFLRARLADNPSLKKDYRQMLEGVADEAIRRALRDGDWDVFAGMFFSEWRRDLHVCEPFKIPDTWPKWRAVDWGYGAPYCCLWAARSPEQRIYIYREQYESGVVDVQQAQRIKVASNGERIRFTVADPSMWNRQPNGTSIAQVYANNGVEMVPANNDRAAGWQRVHEALQWVKYPLPTLQVFSTCTNLIRTLPELVHDKIDVEDVAQGDDHAADSLRYLLAGAATPSAQPQAARFG